jgi:adenylate cyclase
VDALTGTIAMRYSLMKYNKDAEIFTKQHAGEKNAKYKPHIKIGAGLNSGRASVGLMGSKDKMEYTSIGDAVNFASRTESSNKVCGTDILITQDTYDLLKEKFIRCAENNFTILPENAKNEIVVEMIPVEFEVKGKGAQHFYGVVNLPQFDIEEFFLRGDKNFVLDKDCEKACGKNGPATLNEVRELLGIPKPDFEKVNLNEEENKVQVRQ